MDFSKMNNNELYELNIYLHCFSVMLHKLRGDIIDYDTATKVSTELKQAFRELDKELRTER